MIRNLPQPEQNQGDPDCALTIPKVMQVRRALILGATGATGRHVVQNLLDSGLDVSCIVRSKERLHQVVKPSSKLSITETLSFSNLSDQQVSDAVNSVDVIVCCLGHNISFHGIYRDSPRMVTDTVRRFTTVGNQKGKKFVLMGTDGVSHPNDSKPRSFLERSILFLLRHLLPPHYDNEQVAEYMRTTLKNTGPEWIVVRPTDLTDTDAKPYQIYTNGPPGGLFGDGSVARKTVARFMSDLVVKESLWKEHVYTFPVIHDVKEEGKEK